MGWGTDCSHHSNPCARTGDTTAAEDLSDECGWAAAEGLPREGPARGGGVMGVPAGKSKRAPCEVAASNKNAGPPPELQRPVNGPLRAAAGSEAVLASGAACDVLRTGSPLAALDDAGCAPGKQSVDV